MFVRILFLLLLALNLGALGWILSMPPEQPVAPPPSDAGVPKLVLLSERDASKTTTGAIPAEAPTASANHADDVCKSIGPFQTQADLRALMTALTPFARRIQFRESNVSQSRGFWVYLSAFATREQALAAARELSAKGVHDYYVVTAGDQQNTVSLGLFRERKNAERRYAEIVADGFKPQLNERTDQTVVYWLDYAEARGAPIDWRAYAHGADELTESVVPCF